MKMPELHAPYLPLLPLAGRSSLTKGDVLMLLRPAFWPARGLSTEISAHSQATRCALRALAGVDEVSIAAMEVDHALPKGRQSIIVGSRGNFSELPATPALAEMMRAWMKGRTSNSPVLFATHTGALSRKTTSKRVNRAGHDLGFEGLLWDALKAFFVANLERGSDDAGGDDAILCYEARCDGRIVNAKLSSNTALRKLIQSTDPFEGATLQFADDAASIAAAEAAGSVLPATYAACFRLPPLALDHPFLRDLAAISSSLDEYEARSTLYFRHRDDLAHMDADGSLPRAQQAVLFGMKEGSFKAFRRREDAKAGLPPRPACCPGRPRARPPATPKETARLNRVRDLKWPPATRTDDFRLKLLAKQGPFLFGLIHQDKLGRDEVADILRIDRSRLARIFEDFKVGLFGCWLSPPSLEARITAFEVLHDQAARRRPGQSTERFCRDVRKSFGLKISQDDAVAMLRKKTTSRLLGAPRPALSPAEQERLQQVSDAAWPKTWHVEAFRLDLFEAHGEFVCALVDELKLGKTAAAKLFKLYTDPDRLWRLRAALADGTLREGAVRIMTKAEALERRRRVLEDYDGRPEGQTWPEFSLAFERKHGMLLTPSAARAIVWAGRPDTARGKFPVASTVALSDGERRRLKALAAAPWSTCADPDDLRRDLIREVGAFVVGLFDENKLKRPQAARLLDVAEGGFTHIVNAFHDGAIDHLVQPTLPPAERADALRIVLDAHACRRPGEGDTELMRRVRRDHVLLIPDSLILEVLASARRRPPAP
jgi:hypothetical protein